MQEKQWFTTTKEQRMIGQKEIEKKFEKVGLGYIDKESAMAPYLLLLSLADSKNRVSELHWRLPENHWLPGQDLTKLKKLWDELGGQQVFKSRVDDDLSEQILEGAVTQFGIAGHYRDLLVQDQEVEDRTFFDGFGNNEHLFVVGSHPMFPERSPDNPIFHARINGLICEMRMRFHQRNGLLLVLLTVPYRRLTKPLTEQLQQWLPKLTILKETARNDIKTLAKLKAPELRDDFYQRIIASYYGGPYDKEVWATKHDSVLEKIRELLNSNGIPMTALHYDKHKV
ncbi:hypothetical protein ACFLZY_02175 [Patescibacteria group bacterium]